MGNFNKPKKSDIRKKAHQKANLRAQTLNMIAMAINGEQCVVAESSTREALLLAPWSNYLTELRHKLPWNGLEAKVKERGPGGAGEVGKPFDLCAEAHLWLELMGRGKDPRSYTLVSFNREGNIAAPCANCASWVESAFGYVYKETTSYAGRSKQKPNR